MWEKIGWLIDGVLLRVTVQIGQKRHDAGGAVPLVAGVALCHPDEFPQGQLPGIDSDDAGEFPNERP